MLDSQAIKTSANVHLADQGTGAGNGWHMTTAAGLLREDGGHWPT
ncbi:hypothetical protein [Streptomyces canus]